MNRLLQGDVGSGKTLVALMSMLLALDNGYQACMMAPTEILANQHYETIQTLLFGMDVRVELLTGSVKGKKREAILKGLLWPISIMRPSRRCCLAWMSVWNCSRVR